MLIFPSGSPFLSRMEVFATVYIRGKSLWSSSCPPGSLAWPAITIISGSNLTVDDACTKIKQFYFTQYWGVGYFFRLTEDSWEEKKKRAFTEVEWLKWSRPFRGIDIFCPGQALNCMSCMQKSCKIIAYQHPCYSLAPFFFTVKHFSVCKYWKTGNTLGARLSILQWLV